MFKFLKKIFKAKPRADPIGDESNYEIRMNGYIDNWSKPEPFFKFHINKRNVPVVDRHVLLIAEFTSQQLHRFVMEVHTYDPLTDSFDVKMYNTIDVDKILILFDGLNYYSQNAIHDLIKVIHSSDEDLYVAFSTIYGREYISINDVYDNTIDESAGLRPGEKRTYSKKRKKGKGYWG